MKQYTIKTNSNKVTMKLAEIVSNYLNRGDVIFLHSDLGGGKTTFTKGIATGLGVQETVNSPTFNIVKCYFKGRIPLYHIDAYRLEGIKNDIGLDEYIDGDGVCIIEWPEYVDYLWPKDFLMINIFPLGDNEREITFISNSDHYDLLIDEVKKIWDIK